MLAALPGVQVTKAEGDELPEDVQAEIDAMADEARRQWQQQIPLIITELYQDTGAQVFAALRLRMPEKAVEAAMAETFDQVRGISDTLVTDFRRIATEVYAEGRGNQRAVARQLRERWSELSTKRAKRIAETEWNRVASTARVMAGEAQGDGIKRWHTLGDRRVCQKCKDNAAQGEVPIGELFKSGHRAPPGHPQCRCSVSTRASRKQQEQEAVA